MADDSLLIEGVDVAGPRLRIRAGRAFADAFLRDDLWAEYEGISLEQVPRWVLELPFLLNVAPVVWLSGRRFTVPELDEELASSLGRVRAAFQRLYPHLSWSGEIRAERLVGHDLEGAPHDPVTILFTAGIDSTHSSVRNADRRQLLVSVWGTGIALDNTAGWAQVRRMCLAHAERTGNEAAFVRSNVRSFLEPARIMALSPGIPHWWTRVAFGLGYTGLAAPAMAAKGSRRLVVSASHTHTSDEPYGSHPDTDGQLRWGGAEVSHEGFELTRHDKVREIVAHVRSGGVRPMLRPCYSYKYGSGENCGRCEKCLRTSTALLVEGEDPRGYGIPVDPAKLSRVIDGQMRRFTLILAQANRVFHWTDMQRHARRVLQEGMPRKLGDGTDVRPFLRWLVSRDFPRYARRWRIIGAMRTRISRVVARFPAIERGLRRLQARLRDRRTARV